MKSNTLFIFQAVYGMYDCKSLWGMIILDTTTYVGHIFVELSNVRGKNRPKI